MSALKQAELERLDAFLMSDATGAETMDLEMIDGFFVALAISPEQASEEEWLPHIFEGAAPEFKDTEEKDEIIGLIRRHHAAIQAAFSLKARNKETEEPMYVPIVLQDEGIDEKWRETLGAYWASGFRAGVLLREDLWQDTLDENEDLYEIVAKILTLELGHHPDDEEQLLSVKQRDALIDELPWLIEDVLHWWLNKQFGKVETVVHTEPKIGRNDPCSCGSGKKFKKCCGA